jgi:hypothetical protein
MVGPRITLMAVVRALGLALVIGATHLPSTVGAQHSEQRVSPQEARVLANRLTSVGQPSAAREIALGLLRADATDVTALVALARAELALGQIDAAERAAQAALSQARTPSEKFMASLVVADVFAQSERFLRSQFWLRRAIQIAPNPQSEQVAINAFRRVRQENALAVEISFGIMPSSNVNSGNSNEAISFAYLPGYLSEIQWLVPADETPLSGVEFSLRTDLRYRIAETATARTSLEFGIYGRTYVMSNSARATAPEITGESLSYVQTSVGILHQWRPLWSEAPLSASLTYSHDWVGGTPYRYELDGTLGTQFTLTNDDTLAVSGSVRRSHRLTSGVDILSYSLRGRWARTLANEDIVGVTAQVAQATSDVTDLAYRDAMLGVSYDFGEVGFGVDLSTSYTEHFRVYETSAFDPAGRDDRISAVRVDMGLQNVDFYGFQPVFTVKARRTISSVARFDTQGAQLGLNLRSSF